MKLLANLAQTNGVQALSAGIPGYGEQEGLYTTALPANAVRHGTEQYIPETSDSHVILAGKRVGKCANIWQVLGGMAERVEDRVEMSPEEPLSESSWEVLSLLAEIWASEVVDREQNKRESPL